jgi:hypothetical protein
MLDYSFIIYIIYPLLSRGDNNTKGTYVRVGMYDSTCLRCRGMSVFSWLGTYSSQSKKIIVIVIRHLQAPASRGAAINCPRASSIPSEVRLKAIPANLHSPGLLTAYDM